jgi:hypothetical protein
MDMEALNRAIVGRWFAAFWGNPCDLGIVDELAAPDVMLQYAIDRAPRGRQAVRQFMEELRAAFPDFVLRRIGGLISDRDIVVVRWEGGGTHTGGAYDDFHVGPLAAASGCGIVLSGHTAVRLADAQIAEEAIWSTARKVAQRHITGGLTM